MDGEKEDKAIEVEDLDRKKPGIPIRELYIGPAVFRYNSKTEKLELWVRHAKQAEW